MDASNLLKPELARGTLHCVGATTLDEYRKHIEKDAALARRFQSVFVGEPTVEDTISILRGIKDKYELHHGVRITDGALVAAATLSNRYITDRFLPDKAIDLIDEAASRLRMEVDSKPEELDELDRRLMQLRIEREALRKETDAASRDRLERLEAEIADLAAAVGRDDSVLAGREGTGWWTRRSRRSSWTRRGWRWSRRSGGATWARASELIYTGLIPELERKIAAPDGDGRAPGEGGGDRGPGGRRGLALDRGAGGADAGGRALEAAADGG